MRTLSTAIIHLRAAGTVPGEDLMQAMRRLARGVADVRFSPAEGLLTVRFDQDQAGLADLVRLIEDAGTAVAGVALRRPARFGRPRLSSRRRER